MIRPILYVNLPAIVYALDRRARSRQGEFATFICAPGSAEPHGGPTAFLEALTLINPSALTWICEDRWHLHGVAQARHHGAAAWDLTYLAAISSHAAQPASLPTDEVLLELLQYILDAAIMRNVQRVFASIEDDCPEMELFGRVGFQRYARELVYQLDGPALPLAHATTTPAPNSPATTSPALAPVAETVASGENSALWDTPPRADQTPNTVPLARNEPGEPEDHKEPTEWLAFPDRAGRAEAEDPPLRHWHRHDAWGLLRLYDAITPRRVQAAEIPTSDDFAQHRTAVGGTRPWPLVGQRLEAFVCDRGVRLGGWLRLRHGRGSQPHQIWMMVHPEDAHLAGPLLRFGLRRFAEAQPRPILCRVREYDGTTIDALRAAGFAHVGARALLVRHLTLRALRHHTVPALDSRVAYGVKGLGTAPTRYDRGDETTYATSER